VLAQVRERLRSLLPLASARPAEQESNMADNWNDKVIAEFRANEGRVGGNFEGAPVILVHSDASCSSRMTSASMACRALRADGLRLRQV
jgi:hypothetical protein